MIRMCDSDSESHEGKSGNNCVIYPIKQAGMKADGFERRGQSWYVATDFPNDLVVEIEDVSLHIHKFPLFSRCGRLNRMLHEFRSDTEKDHIRLDDIPGGAEAFELAAKFCYGVAVDLNSSNISGLRCAAEYLEMSEDLEEGNLIFKTEAFLSYVVLSSWRDSIIVLKSCEELSPWAENLQIVRRCSESIAWKACANTLKQGVRWSYTVSKSAAKKPNQSPHWNETKTYSPGHQLQVPPDWWFEDVSILRIDHFVKVITAIKVKGMRFELIGASIMHYASKCLPGISGDSSGSEDNNNNNNNDSWKGGGLHIVLAEGRDDLSASNAQLRSEQRLVVESLISILPPQKDTVSCSFLLRLLRMANMLKVAPALVTELEKRVGMQLEQATLNDLLIPSYTAKSGETLYDVDLVQRLLDHFLIQQQTQQPTSPSHCASSAEKHYAAAANAKTKVARLVDSYITEIARDRNLSMTKFQVLAEALPDSARTCDDGLYRAIDSYLKAHPTLSEHERKRLCKVMNCQKLSIDACIHAAHNERLPLRIVVQVLFSEQAKIANAIASNGLPVDKEQTDNHHHHRMDFQSQGTDRFSRVLENLPQSFQEGWSSTKKDIKTIIFDMENLKSKVLQLQSEIDTLNHQFIKFSKPTSSGGGSAWSTGWKKLSKLKHSFVFHTHTQDMGSLRADAPQQVASKTRRWRNSIS